MQGAEYLGPAYDNAAMVYRLKFIRDGKVMYVDVDARTDGNYTLAEREEETARPLRTAADRIEALAADHD